MTIQMTRLSGPPHPRLEWSDDESLVRAAADGDVPAQERLWRTHVDAVYRVCASQLQPADAEDAVAETFLAAFASGSSFDPGRGSVQAWLLGIAVNQVRRRWRTDRRVAATLERVRRSDRRAAMHDDHADGVIARADALIVHAALAQLSDSDRLVLVTQAAGELAPAELAVAIGCSTTAAKVRLHRARRRLADLLEHDLYPTPSHDA